MKSKFKEFFTRQNPNRDINLAQVVICKRFAKIPTLFISVINNENYLHKKYKLNFPFRNAIVCEK